jgi:ectoine hydroxylase
VKLSSKQIAEFDEQGYLFLPNVFSDAEIGVLMREVPGILRQERPEVVREKDGKRHGPRSPCTPITISLGGSPATPG